MHPVEIDDERLLKDCEQQRLKRSGPGGQRRNKVETAVRLRHRPTGLVAEAADSRSSLENLHAALRRLRLLLAVEIRSSAIPEAPSGLWRSRIQSGRIRLNADHDDVPQMLAEALDHLSAADWHVAAAAERLNVTATQLLRLLRLSPPAMALLNRHRAESGLGPMR